MDRRLYRSRTNRIIWGVCGGLAEYFDIDPAIIRVIFVLLIFAGGIGIIGYIILAIFAPLEGSAIRAPRDVVKENVQEIKETTTQLGKEMQSTFARKEGTGEPAPRDERHHLASWLGALLIIVGLFFLLQSIFPFPWFRWDFIWPLIIIGIGLLIIAGRRK